MTGFELHPRLVADCHHLGALALSDVLLNRNAAVPWLILVPRVEVIELCDLAAKARTALDAEIDHACGVLRARFPETTKLNVAAIGNLVPQLHVHVIARHPGDPCWPDPVWGHLREHADWPADDVAGLSAAMAGGPHRS